LQQEQLKSSREQVKTSMPALATVESTQIFFFLENQKQVSLSVIRGKKAKPLKILAKLGLV
jgi:hypothetical protein